MAKPAWLQHAQEISLSQRKQGMGEGKLAVKFQYLIRCFANYPRRLKKNQPELLVWITLQKLSGLAPPAFCQNLPAKFSSKPKLQGYFRSRLFVSFLLILETLFTTTGNDSES